MKYKTTRKEVINGYANKICVGYCELQNLLIYEQPVAYIANNDGWRADIYEIYHNTAIITGYAPFGNIYPPYDTIREYDIKAREILDNHALDFDVQERDISELLDQVVDEVIESRARA